MNREIEEYSLNAWPALQTLVYDGWLLRFAEGYTKRSNSVNPIYSPTEADDIRGKIAKCEEIYTESGMDAAFKITPFVHHSLDKALEDKGYQISEPSSVKVLDRLDDLPEPRLTEIVIKESLSDEWLDIMSELKGLTEKERGITRKILSRVIPKKGYFTLYHDSVPVACGLGVIEQEYVGLYDIVTAENYRNRGYGEQLILNILKWARDRGATKGYLLVVQSNLPANKLYEKLQYKEIYTYWYRVRRK